MAVYELLVVKTSTQTQERLDAVVAFDIEQVLYCTALRVLSTFRNFIAFKPITASLIGEEHHRVVHCCRINVLCKVIVTAVSAFAADSSTRLLTEF